MKKLIALALALLMLVGMIGVASAEDPLKLTGLCVLYQQAPAKDSDFWQYVEKTFNVDYDIEWSPESGYDDKVSLVLSTGDLPDIMQVTSTTNATVVNAANDGLFYDLTDLLDPAKYPNLCALNPAAWTNSKINGRNYFLPRSRGHYNTCLFLRKDILEAANMKVPVTISEFEAYFKYIKDNYPDMIPLAYQFSYMADYFCGAFGEGPILPVYTEDGEGIVQWQLTESYAKMVEWFQHLFAEGLYAKEFALYNTDKNHDMFLAGKTGARHQNLWHRWRLAHSVATAVEGADVACALYVTSDDGKYCAPQYDVGFYGGLVINADLPQEKVEKILEFFDKTSAPDMYNTFRYGLEGVHWNMQDGFPVATDQGKAEITNSSYGPFVLATNLYDKVDSPLATIEYNLETREISHTLDYAASLVGGNPMKMFSIIKSNTWSEYWAVEQSSFDSFVAETISGQHTVDELRDYQARIKAEPEVQEAFKEFKACYDDFGLGNWTPPTLDY